MAASPPARAQGPGSIGPAARQIGGEGSWGCTAGRHDGTDRQDGRLRDGGGATDLRAAASGPSGD